MKPKLAAKINQDNMEKSAQQLESEPPVSGVVSCSALAWTHTKPTIVGLYLLREGPMVTPSLHHLVRNSESEKMNILDMDNEYTFDDVEDLHDSYEWYGPIPWE